MCCSRGWWLIGVDGCEQTPEREEFLLNMANIIDWQQYHKLKEKLVLE